MSTETAEPTLAPVDRLYAEVKAQIEEYCKRHGCAPSILGRVALNDTLFVQRVLNGGSVTTKKLRKLEEFIRADKSPAEARASDAGATAEAL
ncbi:hypothetical protein DK26_23315 [Bosea sp. WAO]|uniref:hypothetical protein n=1 Tax=Bosea sp. WAO TaxID=406341 RepID=UPI00074A1C22|nr:hypothetical protein [Bosea sp. WAO]KUL93452.1 hypothetical protein DK26_23315 [Bosea sp. WAO]